LPPKMKFLGEILAVVVFMNVSQISLQSLGDILGIGEIRLFFLGHLVTIFCMVGVMSALNLSDGLDGLAAGISVIACFFCLFSRMGIRIFCLLPLWNGKGDMRIMLINLKQKG